MLKNWTVTTQAVKNGTDGITARERYLLSSKHPNHRNTDAIISIVGSAETSQRIALAGERFRLKQKLVSRRGGRPLTSYAMEYCLTLTTSPSPSQWRAIVQDCCAALATKLALNAEEKKQFARQVRAVCHQKKQSGHSHVHLIIGKVVADRVLKELQKKEATKLIKLAFNAAVLAHLGLDNRDYRPYEYNRGKRLENWRYQQQKVQESLEVQKQIEKMQKQADKWFEAHKQGDAKQLNRQFNRLAKTFGQLAEMSYSEATQQQLVTLKGTIEAKTGRKF